MFVAVHRIGGAKLLRVMELVRPHLELTFDNILAHINTIYVLKTRQGALDRITRDLRLKVCLPLFVERSAMQNKTVYAIRFIIWLRGCCKGSTVVYYSIRHR